MCKKASYGTHSIEGAASQEAIACQEAIALGQNSGGGRMCTTVMDIAKAFSRFLVGYHCNYEANPRYCTFANSWSTPCREHSICLYLCTVLLLRLVHET